MLRRPTCRRGGCGGASNGPAPGANSRAVAGLVSAGTSSPGSNTRIPGAASRPLEDALTTSAARPLSYRREGPGGCSPSAPQPREARNDPLRL